VFTYGTAMRNLVLTDDFNYLFTHRGNYTSSQLCIDSEMFHVSLLSR